MPDDYDVSGSITDNEWESLQRRRSRANRRTWVLIALLVVVAIILAWLTVRAGSGGEQQQAATATTTVDQRALADGQRALTDWGRFAVTKDLAEVKESFWSDGPQYKELATEARQGGEALGPPAYQITMSGARVITRSGNERVLRGKVEVTRPGEVVQHYQWDVLMRRDDKAGGRWRLWTVRGRS
ncbi:MAG TPA: hypothetical protein VGR68_08555 [Actinomycetota bacterium]|jgi:hypothetical protein|nr:hypothetical protein [Actinomycetota bacterium]